MSVRVRKVYGHRRRWQRWDKGGWRDITEAEYEAAITSKRPDYAKGELPGLHTDYGDWSAENGGRGRYCGIAAAHAQDSNAYFRHREDLCDWATRSGKVVTR